MLSKKVKDVMTKNVIVVSSKEQAVFAFEKLMKNKISALPVIDDDIIVGIVTASDLGHNLLADEYELGAQVKDVMVKDVISIGPDELLSDAVKIMKDSTFDSNIINQLPVVENERLVGIISDGDIIKALL
jgi:CBS domain-containing protein